MKPADTIFGNTRMPSALADSSRALGERAYKSASALSTSALISRQLGGWIRRFIAGGGTRGDQAGAADEQ